MRRLVVALALVPLLLLTGMPAALAGTVTLPDPRGDMWRHDGGDVPTPAPHQHRADLRRVVVHHTASTVVVRARFVRLQRTGSMTMLGARLRTGSGLVRFANLRAGTVSPQGWRGHVDFTGRGGRPVPCRVAHRVDYAAEVAWMRVPRSCLDRPRWVRATVVSGYVGPRSVLFTDSGHGDGFRTDVWTRRIRRG